MSKNRKIVIGVLVFPLGIYWFVQHAGMKQKPGAIVVTVILSLIVVGGLSSLGGGDSKKKTAAPEPVTTQSAQTTPPPTQTTAKPKPAPVPAAAPEPKANVYIVASKSLCTATGIDDAYTGEGHVEFFYTFKNSGGAEGKISVTPVRHYDDGSTNESPFDTADVTVNAHSTYKTHTDAFKYKAHEHEVSGCGAKIDGEEIPISFVHL